MNTSSVTKELYYTVLFDPDEDGGYVVTVPALPGLVTGADTLQEARRMAKDAIMGYLESLRKDGLPVPSDKPLAREPVKKQIRITIQSS